MSTAYIRIYALLSYLLCFYLVCFFVAFSTSESTTHIIYYVLTLTLVSVHTHTRSYLLHLCVFVHTHTERATPIAKAMHAMVSRNPRRNVSIVVNRLSACLNNCITDPHQRKYQRIRVSLFFVSVSLRCLFSHMYRSVFSLVVSPLFV